MDLLIVLRESNSSRFFGWDLSISNDSEVLHISLSWLCLQTLLNPTHYYFLLTFIINSSNVPQAKQKEEAL